MIHGRWLFNFGKPRLLNVIRLIFFYSLLKYYNLRYLMCFFRLNSYDIFWQGNVVGTSPPCACPRNYCTHPGNF